MAAFIAKQMVGNQLSAVKGKLLIINLSVRKSFKLELVQSKALLMEFVIKGKSKTVYDLIFDINSLKFLPPKINMTKK